MTAITFPNDDPGFGLRREVTAEELDRARRDYEAAREQNARIESTVLTVGAILVCLGVGWLVRRRSQIAAVADKAAVEVASRGLKAKRKTDSAVRNFAERVRNRADADS